MHEGLLPGCAPRKSIGMTEPFAQKIPRATVKRRQLEIEQCLSEYGLVRRPRRLLHGAGPASSEDTHCRRVRAALARLGPVISSFGLYLSSRVDLLPADYRVELSAIPDWAQPTPISSVRELISRGLDCPFEEAYPAFEHEPFESRLMYQSHRALLNNGQAVAVKVTHSDPELEEQIACDVELLPLLKGAFGSREWTGSQFDGTVADFRQVFRQHKDFLHEAEALEALAHDSKEFEMLGTPGVLGLLCSSKVIAVEQVPGISLAELVAHLDAPQREENAAGSAELVGGIDRSDLARRLCLVWLRLALLGQRFPVEPRVEDILILPDKRIAFTGGTFSGLDSDAKTHLLSYLVAASTEDPGKACSWLIKETEKGNRTISEEELRNRFRQVVPFRDGGWINRDANDSLAEYLFVHWKLASKYGYRPLPHLLSFFRGLFLITAAARRLDSKGDPLLEALENLRFHAVVTQFRDMMVPSQFGESIDKYAVMMMELPGKLNDVLTFAAEGSARVRLRITETDEYRLQKNSSAISTALLLVLAAIVLLSHHFMASAVNQGWADRISAIVFVLFGALLLRAVTRR